MANSVKIKLTSTAHTDALLRRLPLVARDIYLTKGLRKVGTLIKNEAKKRCPKGGPRTGKKAGKKHLRDTIRSEVRDYGRVKVLVVGPEYPAGAHGHLVEFGHREFLFGRETGRRVPPKPFMRPAVDLTKSEQMQILDETLRAGIEKEAANPT